MPAMALSTSLRSVSETMSKVGMVGIPLWLWRKAAVQSR
jgi:hypothetical protein